MRNPGKSGGGCTSQFEAGSVDIVHTCICLNRGDIDAFQQDPPRAPQAAERPHGKPKPEQSYPDLDSKPSSHFILSVFHARTNPKLHVSRRQKHGILGSPLAEGGRS